MRLLLSLLILTISGYYQFNHAEEPEVTGIKDVIEQLIEKVRDEIPEPIAIKSDTIEMPDNDYLTGKLDVANLQLTGIKEFKADLKYVLLVPRSFNISFEYIDLNLDYVSNLELLNQNLLSIFGEGHALMTLSDLVVTGKIKVGSLSPLNVTVNSMDISLDVAKFLFTGLMDDADFTNSINSYLNKNFANLFNENSDILATALTDVVNGLLSNISLSGVGNVMDDYNDYNDYNEDFVESVFQPMVEYLLSVLKWD